MDFAQIVPRRRCWFVNSAVATALLLLAGAVASGQAKPQKQTQTPAPEAAWTEELNKHPELLAEFGQIVAKMQQVQFPAARSESRLLALLSGSTIFYGAFSNYGGAARQALQVFRGELQDSADLRQWWTHGDRATNGPKIEDTVEKFAQLHDYLGDEIIVAAVMDDKDPKKDPELLMIAQAKKPGLKKYLDGMIAQLADKSNSGVTVLDEKELSTILTTLKKELLVLVRPDFVVATTDLATLRNFNEQLGRRNGGFAATPFGQRVAREYQSGVTVLAAVDAQRIIKQASASTQQDASFQQSGFADMKYFVWQHKDMGPDTIGQAELSFTGPRHGAAAWLGKPVPMGSLDFVSPKAMMALSLSLSNPARMFDDIRELSKSPAADPFAAVESFQNGLNLSLKDDVLNLLTGEITAEVDTITATRPVWRAVLGVKDADHLQRTLAKILTAAQFPVEPATEGSLTYYTVRIPTDKTTMEIGYTLVDGYWVIGSGREAVAQAVAMHNSGGSLRKSQQFLAALPPGHSVDSSLLFYEDPMAMAALQMQRFAPSMAAPLVQLSGQTASAVICLYGDDAAIREASRSGAFDVGAMLVFSAVAIPNLLRSRIAANEATAVGGLRTINTAQVTYAATYSQRGFAQDLATLGSDPRNPSVSTEDRAALLDETLANPSCTAGTWCTKSGYHFRITTDCKRQPTKPCTEYLSVAAPVDSNTGTRNFCSTSDAIIRVKSSEPLNGPLTVAQCRAWPSLQ